MNYEFDGFVAFLPPVLWVTTRVTRAFLAFVLSPANASPGGRKLYCMRPVSIHELLGVRPTNLTWYFPRLRLVRSRPWLFFNNQLFQLFCFRKTYLATKDGLLQSHTKRSNNSWVKNQSLIYDKCMQPGSLNRIQEVFALESGIQGVMAKQVTTY